MAHRLGACIIAGLVLSSVPAHALTPDDFLPIELKCPTEAGGVLEVISENILGQRERLRVIYRGSTEMHASVEVSEPGEEFAMLFDYDFIGAMELAEFEMSRYIVETTRKADQEHCFADGTVKPSYLATLAENRERLRNER